LTAYAGQRQRRSVSGVTIARREVWSLSDAREILTRMAGTLKDWTPLEHFLAQYIASENEEERAKLKAVQKASTG